MVHVFIYCALFTVQKYNKKMTYANLYAIFLQIYLLSPARFLIRITRISAYTSASIIYKKSLFFEENVRKICEYQKLVVSLHRICN